MSLIPRLAAVLIVLALSRAVAWGQSFVRVADVETIGGITSFDPSPVGASFFPNTREVSFRAFGPDREAIYYYNAGALERLVDLDTPVPGTSGTFDALDTPSGAGGIAFRASGAGREGIYRAFPGGAGLQVVEDAPAGSATFGRAARGYGPTAYRRGDAVRVDNAPANFTPAGYLFVGNFGTPDVGGIGGVYVRADFFNPNGPPTSGTGIFLAQGPFAQPQLIFQPTGQTDDVSAGLGGTIAVIARGGTTPGVMWAQPFGVTVGSDGGGGGGGGGPDGFPQGVVALGTPIPGGTGGFTNFRSVSAGGLENVIPSMLSFAFLGEGSGGQQGIYWFDTNPSQPHKLIARGDALDGRIVDHLDLGRDGASAEIIAFHARFTDGSAGIYYGVVPEPALFGVAPLLFAFARRRRRE